jgi:lysine 2,3-aminomutase
MTVIKDFPGLIAAGLADPADEKRLESVSARYALAIPAYLARRLAAEPAGGPLRRQYLPDAAEAVTQAKESADPIGDAAHAPVKGIVHRYPDRALLKPLHACAVYCRFCFRREMVGPGGEALNDAELAAALAYIAGRPEIWEVIVTGGDPFMLSPRRLGRIIDGLAAIPHVESVRFHTRVPVADPERVDAALVAALRHDRPAVWVAVHINHPDEFTAESTAALARLADAGIPLAGQTVLLKGVNDDADTLAALFRAMVRRRVKPYYLHHPDLAPGTAHFRPTLAEGDRLMKALRGRLSGLAQPTYVLDIPGGYGKVPAGAAWIRPELDGACVVEDPQGRTHRYEE